MAETRDGGRTIRVIVTKIGLDGHDLGARLVTHVLSRAGMEVVYLGKFQTPESIASAAVTESADVVGVSVLSPNHVALIPEVLARLRASGAEGVKVVVGGIVPEAAAVTLYEAGVSRIFGHHATSAEIVGGIRALVQAG